MKMRIFWRVLLVIVLVAAVVGLGFLAYRAGSMHSIGRVGRILERQPNQNLRQFAPMVSWRPFFFPFGGLIACLGGLFLLFLVFAAVRGLFWHRPSYWRNMGLWGEHEHDVPTMFEEWHRRAHAGQTPDQTQQPPSGQSEGPSNPTQ